MSSLDLAEGKFALLAAQNGEAWCAAATKAAETLRVSLTCARVGIDIGDPRGRWPSANGIGKHGALLVRPDGFVCWRAVKGPPTGQSADAVLLQVLSRVLSLLEQALDSV